MKCMASGSKEYLELLRCGSPTEDFSLPYRSCVISIAESTLIVGLLGLLKLFKILLGCSGGGFTRVFVFRDIFSCHSDTAW